MAAPGQSMDYPGEQAAAELAHDDLNRGSISDRDSTMRRSVSSANCKGRVTAV